MIVTPIIPLTKPLSRQERRSFPLVTPRERQVVELLSKGETAKEIAAILHLSPYTINSHKKNLIRKMKAKNTVEMVVKVMRMEEDFFQDKS